MPDFLTRRNGMWHFVRRVPAEFASLDSRGIVRHSTKIPVASDRTGRRAIRVAEQLNAALHDQWLALAGRNGAAVAQGHDEARRRARSLSFGYAEASDIVMLSAEKRFDRLEALVARGLENDAGARAALLGTQARPSFPLSKLFEEYEAATRDETKKFSPNQMRVWRNSRLRVVKELVAITGDKPVTEITYNDAIDYSELWRERCMAGEANAMSGYKSMGMLSRMLKEMSIRRRLNLPEIFKGLRLKSDVVGVRAPFDVRFIQERLLADGVLDGLNEDARLIFHVLADTELRPSEAANLQPNAIHLDAPIPYVEILPDGRVLKTGASKREVPLVGTALAAMKLRPGGFPS